MFRTAGSDWFVYDVMPEVQQDEDGRKFIEMPEASDAVWVPRNSELGQAIAEVLGA